MFGSLNINETVTYNCADGYELQGAENLTCQMDGTLSAQPPECVRGRNTVLEKLLWIFYFFKKFDAIFLVT